MEECVLGCMLSNSNMLKKACTTLTYDMFTTKINGILFGHIIKFYKDGRFVDDSIMKHSCSLSALYTLEGISDDFINRIHSSRNITKFIGYVEYIREMHKKSKFSCIIKDTLENSFRLNIECTLDKLRKKLSEFYENSNDNHHETNYFDLEKEKKKMENTNLYDIGFEGLNFINKDIVEGSLIIIGARTSVGKSAFAVNILSNLSLKGDKKIDTCILSLEMSQDGIKRRIVSMNTDIPLDKLRTLEFTQEEENKIKELNNQEKSIYIAYVNKRTIDGIIERIKYFNDMYSIKVFTVDYIQLLSVENCNNTPRHLEMAHITSSLKLLAEERNIVIFALAQLGRQSSFSNNPNLKLSDLKDSSSIEHDADIVILLGALKEEEKDLLKVDVAKNREGRVGSCILTYNKETQKIY